MEQQVADLTVRGRGKLRSPIICVPRGIKGERESHLQIHDSTSPADGLHVLKQLRVRFVADNRPQLTGNLPHVSKMIPCLQSRKEVTSSWCCVGDTHWTDAPFSGEITQSTVEVGEKSMVSEHFGRDRAVVESTVSPCNEPIAA